MRSDWTWRWWDALALIAVLASGALMARYAVSRGAYSRVLTAPVDVEMRVAQPWPEWVGLLNAPEPVFDLRHREIGTLLWYQPVPASDGGRPDLRLGLRLREIPPSLYAHRASRPPDALKPGFGCWVITPRVELFGVVLDVKPSPL